MSRMLHLNGKWVLLEKKKWTLDTNTSDTRILLEIGSWWLAGMA